MKLNKIILYDEPTVPEIEITHQKKFLESIFGLEIEIRDNFFQNLQDEECRNIASKRVFELKKPFQQHDPTQDEIEIERSNKDMTENDEVFLYDGYELEQIVAESIKEQNLDTLHIIFTNKLTATFSEEDFRYHARALIGTNPTIISTTGIIEAPAKPKQYYMELIGDFSEERIKEIKEKYKGQFLEYHDNRLGKIVEGYLLQAIFYVETGNAFCDNKDCRLFNAHWQKDLFESQLKNPQLCEKHSKELEKLLSTNR
ncbi:DUF6775 family putative metallopeptidase [Nitrosopumilus sp.]|uniref:DUF6775 family putative metallopeptidase n=1 Tax=Nitrosopumilus sp. TaxID=2024843 RepID=UPI00261D559D|nr:DUF6775 family putative metallopeptidase [Nitrosopumilus sp.]